MFALCSGIGTTRPVAFVTIIGLLRMLRISVALSLRNLLASGSMEEEIARRGRRGRAQRSADRRTWGRGWRSGRGGARGRRPGACFLRVVRVGEGGAPRTRRGWILDAGNRVFSNSLLAGVYICLLVVSNIVKSSTGSLFSRLPSRFL